MMINLIIAVFFTTLYNNILKQYPKLVVFKVVFKYIINYYEIPKHCLLCCSTNDYFFFIAGSGKLIKIITIRIFGQCRRIE